jgi:hypothetical protein
MPATMMVARNRMPHMTVVGVRGAPIVLDPLGADNDMQPVPEEYRNDPNLIRAAAQGLIELIEDEDLVRSIITRSAEKHTGGGFEKMKGTVAGNIDHNAEDALLSLACVARPNGVACTGNGLVKVSERLTKPSLCVQHAHFQNRLIPVPDDQNGGVVWMLPADA